MSDRARRPAPSSRSAPGLPARLAILAALACAVVLSASGCGLLSGKDRSDGISLYEAGKFGEAIPKLKSALRARPSDLEARRVLALALTKNDDGNEAIDEWLRVLKSSPNSADAHYWLGIAYLSTNRKNKAMEEWVKTVELDSTYISAHYNLGFAYAQMGLAPLAVEQWSQLLLIDPTHYEAHVNRGKLRVMQRDFHGGLEDFLIALAISPEKEINWLTAGESYFLCDDSLHAVAYIDSFLANHEEQDDLATRARELRRRIVAGEKPPKANTSSLGVVPRQIPAGSPSDTAGDSGERPDTTLQ